MICMSHLFHPLPSLRSGSATPTLFKTILMFLLFQGCQTENREDPVLASLGNEQLTLNEVLGAVPHELLSQDSLYPIKRYQEEWLRSRIITAHAAELALGQAGRYTRRVGRGPGQVLQHLRAGAILAKHRAVREV